MTKVDVSGDGDEKDLDDHLVEDSAANGLTWPRPSLHTRENSVETVEEKMVESNT